MKVSLTGCDKPLFAMKCLDGYWISQEFGNFLKTESGKIKVFDKEFVLESHELYKQDFEIQYKQDLIKSESIKKGEPVPMLSIKFDDKDGIFLLKSIFGKTALDNSEGIEDLESNIKQALNKKSL